MNFRYILQNLHKVIFDRFLALHLQLDADAPTYIRKLLSNFLTLPNSSVTVKVTGKRVNRFGGYGLAILMTYSDLVLVKVIEWKGKLRESSI